MSSIASWAGSGVAVVAFGVCWLLLRHLNHLPSKTHPWLHRLAIIGMYCAGVAAVLTAAGGWLLAHIRGILGIVGASTAPHSGLGWALITIAALSLAATIIVAIIWEPDPRYAYIALAAPLVLALAPGGAAHQVYSATAAPATSLVQQVATWAGG